MFVVDCPKSVDESNFQLFLVPQVLYVLYPIMVIAIISAILFLASTRKMFDEDKFPWLTYALFVFISTGSLFLLNIFDKLGLSVWTNTLFSMLYAISYPFIWLGLHFENVKKSWKGRKTDIFVIAMFTYGILIPFSYSPIVKMIPKASQIPNLLIFHSIFILYCVSIIQKAENGLKSIYRFILASQMLYMIITIINAFTHTKHQLSYIRIILILASFAIVFDLKKNMYIDGKASTQEMVEIQ
jgi:hypothetical protein